MLQIVGSLTDDPRGIIYDCNVFIVEAPGGFKCYKTFSLSLRVRDNKLQCLQLTIILNLTQILNAIQFIFQLFHFHWQQMKVKLTQSFFC
jgi:hypothetical protein